MSTQDKVMINQPSNGDPDVMRNPNVNEPNDLEQVERARAETEKFQRSQKRYKAQSGGYLSLPGSAQDEDLDALRHKLPRARHNSSITIVSGEINTADTTMENTSITIDSIDINTAHANVGNSPKLGNSALPNFPAVRSFLSTRPATIRKNPDFINTGVTHALPHPYVGIIPFPGWLVQDQFQFLNLTSPLTPSMDLRFGMNQHPTNFLCNMEQLVTPDPPFDVDWDPRVVPYPPRIYDGIKEVTSLTDFIIKSAARTPVPQGMMPIIEARVAVEHQRLRSARRHHPKMRETKHDIRRNMAFLASELTSERDYDYIDRQMKDPAVENLKHLAAIGVLKKDSPIVSAATRELDNENGESPNGRHFLEQKWQLERTASSRYALNCGSQPPDWAFNLHATERLITYAGPGGSRIDEFLASAKRHEQQKLEKGSFETYDNLFTLAMEDMKEGPYCDLNCMAGKPAWTIVPEQDYGDVDDFDDGHHGFDGGDDDDDGDGGGDGDECDGYNDDGGSCGGEDGCPAENPGADDSDAAHSGSEETVYHDLMDEAL